MSDTPTKLQTDSFALQQAMDARGPSPWNVPLGGSNSTTITQADLSAANDPNQLVRAGNLEMRASQAVQAGLIKDAGQDGFVPADDSISVSPDIDEAPGAGDPIDPTAPHVEPEVQLALDQATSVLAAVEQATGADGGAMIDGLIEGFRAQVVDGYKPDDGRLEGLSAFAAKMSNDGQLQAAMEAISTYVGDFFAAVAEHRHIDKAELERMMPKMFGDPEAAAMFKLVVKNGQAAAPAVGRFIDRLR